MRAPILVSLAAIGLFLSAGPVFADEPGDIAVLALEISGDGPPELRQQLQSRIVEGLSSSGAKVTPLDSTMEALKETPDLIGCSSSACLEQISDLLGTERFVRGVIVASGANYEIRLELLRSSEEEGIANSVADSCAVCTIAELNTLTAELAGKLLKRDEAKLLPVRITTTPVGGTLSIDGVESGVAPLQVDLKAGEYHVVATMDGRITSEMTLVVQEGTTDFELPLSAMLQEPHYPEGKDYGLLKWGAAAGSGVMLILGTVLIAEDGSPTCDLKGSTCPETRATMLGGVLSLTGGIALGAASGWMFWREARDAKERAGVTLSVTPTRALAGYSLRF